MNAFFNVVLLLLTVLVQDIATVPPNNRIMIHKSQRTSHAYQFEYETEDGSRRQEVGTFIYKENQSEPILHVKGMYSYLDRDGRKYVVHYEADDKGTKNDGDVVPPLPNVNGTSKLLRYLKSD